ncbi:unnamed protein product [Oppiella nova]|uniref:Uncharacterized protein n=1 Tax=Oppiella nova TaxID=334625 RepID=A0A7R9QZE8_9ACAR|nr:unnamed protein product [Oppiella nova]CAG2180123.1 unnamed protein product [Oppiella nova]
MSALKASVDTDLDAMRDEIKGWFETKEWDGKDMMDETVALRETAVRIDSQYKELRREFNELKARLSKTNTTSEGKASQNPLNTTTSETLTPRTVIDMFNEIRNQLKVTNSLLNDMNEDNDVKALIAPEGMPDGNDSKESRSRVTTKSLRRLEKKTNLILPRL